MHRLMCCIISCILHHPTDIKNSKTGRSSSWRAGLFPRARLCQIWFGGQMLGWPEAPLKITICETFSLCWANKQFKTPLITFRVKLWRLHRLSYCSEEFKLCVWASFTPLKCLNLRKACCSSNHLRLESCASEVSSMHIYSASFPIAR